jgi:hypothetical protein
VNDLSWSLPHMSHFAIVCFLSLCEVVSMGANFAFLPRLGFAFADGRVAHGLEAKSGQWSLDRGGFASRGLIAPRSTQHPTGPDKASNGIRRPLAGWMC